jgi:hypothetical protein
MYLWIDELEQRIAPSGFAVTGAREDRGNWGGGPGNSDNGDQNGANDQGGGGQPGGNPGGGSKGGRAERNLELK